jgi:hypothetical protein
MIREPAISESRSVRPISIRTLLITVVLSSAVSLLLMLSKPALVRVNGQRIVSDVSPVTGVHERFLPLRAISLGLGAVTSFESKNGRIEVMRGRDTLIMHIGERHATLNGVEFTLAHAPFLVRGRVMVPSNVFIRALHSDVHYDGTSETIDVNSGRTATELSPS